MLVQILGGRVRALAGKSAIVTGAGRGIGREHALALARAGASVVVNDRGSSVSGAGTDCEPALKVVDEIERSGGQAVANCEDVADFSGAKRLIDQAISSFGRLDILVNNAGILRDRMLVNLEEDDWDSVITVHLKGHFAPSRHAAAHWRERAKAGECVRGRIINTSSPSGLFGNIGQTNYGTAKAGIAAFTIIAALELSRYGVTVNCIAPNARTRMSETAFQMPDVAGGFDPLAGKNITPIVVALASDEAQAISGQVFHIYGGVVNRLQPWSGGEAFVAESGWEPDELLAELLARFPKGLAPAGMDAGMLDAGAQPLAR